MKDALRYIDYVRTSTAAGKDLDKAASAKDIEESYELFKDCIVGVKAVAVPLRLIEGYPDDSLEFRQGKGMLFHDGSALITFGDLDGDGGVLTLDLDDQSDRYTLQTIVTVSKKLYREAMSDIVGPDTDQQEEQS